MSSDDSTAAVLANLEACLRAAARLRAEMKDDGRLAAKFAVAGCIEFIHNCRPWREAGLDRVLQELADALTDLDAGHVAPMLRQVKRPGQPPSIRAAAFRGYAAGIMGGLMNIGMGEGKAASWVADRLQKAGFRVTGTTIKYWRKEGLERPKSHLGERYAVVLSAPRWSAGVPYAEELAARLPEMFPAVALKK